MERTMHRQLKQIYADGDVERTEVSVHGYRVDAVAPDGTIIEVQSGPFGPLRGKVARLLELGHRVCLVKPLIVEKRIVRFDRRGRVLSARRSPKQGALVDVFDDLMGIARLLPHRAVAVEVVCVAIDEVRVTRRRWPGYTITERSIREIRERRQISGAPGLWSLLPGAPAIERRFTTRDISDALSKPLWFAQRVAYCLHQAQASALVGKQGRLRLYERVVSTSLALPA